MSRTPSSSSSLGIVVLVKVVETLIEKIVWFKAHIRACIFPKFYSWKDLHSLRPTVSLVIIHFEAVD